VQVLLRSSRVQLTVLAAGLAVSALCWIWSLRAAEHLHHVATVGPLFAMWAVMMAGMMIPPEMPALLALSRATQSLAQAAAFLCGYLAPWIAFSLGAALLHGALLEWNLLDREMVVGGRVLPATVLAVAGLCQMSPMKRACLLRCERLQSSEPTRPAFVGGMLSGIVSVASCGVLMLVLFVTGVMSALAMVALTALLLVERVAPVRLKVSTMAGVVLLACAAWMLV
jgi:predicted metal-binding membrane protein